MKNCENRIKVRSQRTKRKYLRLSQIYSRRCTTNVKWATSKKRSVQSDSSGHSKRLSTNGETKLSALVEVEHKRTLDEHPVIVRLLLKSHVSGGFWMRFSSQFCKKYLPLDDTIIVLETENGERYNTKYLPRSCGLSGGWRSFAKDEKLEAGDVVVFQLVEAAKFKVYIIRRHASHGVPSLISVHNSNTHPKQSVSDADQRRKEHQPSETKLCTEDVHFENITNFEMFETEINNLLHNHSIPDHILHTYYQLCCSQSAFLHACLFEGINSKRRHSIISVTFKGILSEIVDVANALRTCKLSTFRYDQFTSWDRSLNCHEALGMNVEFLRARLAHLRNLAVRSKVCRKKYKEASFERRRSEAKARKLKSILSKLRKTSGKLASREVCSQLVIVNNEMMKLEALIHELGMFFCLYDVEIERLKSEADNYELKFHEAAGSPW